MDPLTHLPLLPPAADFGPGAGDPPETLDAFIRRCESYRDFHLPDEPRPDAVSGPSLAGLELAVAVGGDGTPPRAAAEVAVTDPVLDLAEGVACADVLAFARIRLARLPSEPSRERVTQVLADLFELDPGLSVG